MSATGKRKLDPSDAATPKSGPKHGKIEDSPAQPPNLSFVPKQWTPSREKRGLMKTEKVRSAKDGAFLGGDWVLNSDGGGATLSFCFDNEEGECFGLTVGHLVDKVGDAIFRFSESDPIPLPDDSGKLEYFMFEVGEVTSISKATDSLVFKMNLKSLQYEPRRIALSDQSRITLGTDMLSTLKAHPEWGTSMLGFGAQRRGTVCQVCAPSSEFAGEFSLVGDIGLQSLARPTETQTNGGDCGAIFFSMGEMEPFYFHHVLSTLSDGTQISYGVPLLEVLKAHEETRHLVRSLAGEQESDPPKKKNNVTGTPAVLKATEKSGLHQFHTRITDAPRHDDPLIPAKDEKKETPVRISGAPGPVYTVKEDQTLPKFNIRVKP